jgi:SH3-like domain-containing protein
MRFMRFKALLNPSLALLCLGFSLISHAEFRSVGVVKAVLFDAPSTEASRIFILNQGYPVEVIVNLGQWLKVRDQLGSLSWIESKNLATKRTVLVNKKTDIKSSGDINSPLVATIDKDVVLELISNANKNGWIEVKHRDGLTGFVLATDVWGF